MTPQGEPDRAPGSVWPAALLALAALSVALVRLPYGINFGDEGFYLAASQGPVLGAFPFRDDVAQTQMPLLAVLTPAFNLLPGGGRVLAIRLLGLAVRAACSAALLLALRRWLSPLSLAGAFALVLLVNYSQLLIPSYNSLPSDLGFAALACWIRGCDRGGRSARICGGFAGLLLGLAILCYLPRVMLAGVPLAALAWARTRERWTAADGLAASSAACAITMAATFGAALAALAWSGLWPDFVRAFAFTLTLRPFGWTLGARLLGLISYDMPRAWASALCHGTFWAAAAALSVHIAVGGRRAWRAAAGLALVTLAYALLLLRLYASAGDRWHWAYYLIYPGLCWLPLLAYPWLRHSLRFDAALVTAGDLLFATGAVQQLAVAAASSQGTAAGIPSLAASLALLLLLVAAWVRGRDLSAHAASRATAIAASSLGLVLAATAATHHWYADQDPLRGRLTRFTQGRLAGLRSHPRYVRGWTSVIGYLAPRLARGELLLAYDEAPLLYYATETRPALGPSYVSRALYNPAQMRALIAAMRAAGREPRYAVRLRSGTADLGVWYSTDPEQDPLNAYVLEHYWLEAQLPLFDVFRHKS